MIVASLLRPVRTMAAMRMAATIATGMLYGAIVASLGCSPSSLVDVQNPGSVVNPSLVQTASGASQLRTAALFSLLGAYGADSYNSVISMSGTLTDEMQDPYYSGQSGDDRQLLNVTDQRPYNAQGFGYGTIQQARVAIRQAIEALQLYATNSPQVPRAWQGELYALQGYTIVWLAELYCSGIPLSASSLKGVQVPTRGLSTEELLTTAVAYFDSAMVVSADSVRFVNLARIGKARALVDLGRYATADTVAGPVPTDFIYRLPSVISGPGPRFNFPNDEAYGTFRVQDHEGGNGLIWSADPRTGVTTVPDYTGPMLWPSKYNVDTIAGVLDPTTQKTGLRPKFAEGVEARLIQAEAALARGDGSWLTILNTLRATCIGTASCAPVPGITAASLPPLTDPGTATRIDTLMKERAMWLYLTGHREGDLRRMARQYGRNPNTLWPTGVMSQPAYPDWFPDAGIENGALYGPDTVYGPDVNEKVRNVLYSGCIDTAP